MPEPQHNSNACLFVSHRNSLSLVREFLKIRTAAGENTTFWAHDFGANEPAPNHPDISVFEFDAESLSGTYDAFMGNTIVPGNGHFIIIDFWRRNPSFDHYWVIENDVRFTGDWLTLFEYFKENASDFLSSHIRRHDPESTWYWWPHLTHPTEHIPLQRRLKSFNPVFRISSHALSLIDQYHLNGWTGHHEVLLPTLLHENECKIEDFGGHGEFVPPERHDQFYVRHRLIGRNTDVATGTHRYRPPKSITGIRRNKIHHPVKPLPDVAGYYVRRLRRKLRFWKKQLFPQE